jgi:hypothetical protein
MFQFALWLILLLPFVGLVLISASPEEYIWLTSGGSAVMPLILYSIFLFGAIGATTQFNKSRFEIGAQYLGRSRSEFSSLILIFFILVIVLLGFDGLKVLLGGASKEDIRQSGFIYAIIAKYFLPSLFAYISAKRRMHLVSRSQWWLAFLMTVSVGLSMGGKASVLILVLPGLAILFGGKLSLFRLLNIAGIVFLSLMATAWLFDSFLDRDFITIASYLARRAFILTAEAPFHVGFSYVNNLPTIEYHYTLFEVFGKSVLANFVPPHEIHNYIFSHSVTAWLYPNNIDAVVSGAWNITPNVFVEALIAGGPFFLPVLGWITVYFGYFLWARMVLQLNNGQFASAAITSVYAVMVYLSWMNSAGIMQLIHPLVISSLAFSWLCLRTLSRIKMLPRLQKSAFYGRALTAQ